jgi:hypothetical protein
MNKERINRIIKNLSKIRFKKTKISEETVDDIILKVAEINNNLIELLALFYKK